VDRRGEREIEESASLRNAEAGVHPEDGFAEDDPSLCEASLSLAGKLHAWFLRCVPTSPLYRNSPHKLFDLARRHGPKGQCHASLGQGARQVCTEHGAGPAGIEPQAAASSGKGHGSKFFVLLCGHRYRL
jgi:hypothetical protein